uniref:interleukin-5 receptor subunit alpha-like isoform X2 n=1 Tax=Pristiophorus japonicus TaxID=55135 RepID=UPI00398F28A0
MMLATSFLLMAAVWTITVIGAALAPMEETSNPSSVSNLKCMFYDNVSMNCTWDINKQAPPDAQYDLYYMLQYTNERKYCKSYLTHGRRKGACHVEKYNLQPIDDATICVADSRPNLMKPYCKDITPLTFYEVGPPMNIKETESHIEWEPPRGKHPLNDFIYQIQIADGSNYVKAEIETVDVEKWNIRNQLKSYSLRVRTRIKNYISRSPWSAWSESVNIETETERKHVFENLDSDRSYFCCGAAAADVPLQKVQVIQKPVSTNPRS